MKYNELTEQKDFKDITYFDLLNCEEWKDKRIEILIRDSSKCTKCNRIATMKTFSGSNVINFFTDGQPNPENLSVNLQIHHTLYIYNRMPWNYENHDLITLCNFCHEELHNNESIIVWDEQKLNKMNSYRCDKCSGKGFFKEYKHISHGICFKCRGYGYDTPFINLKK